MKQQIIHTFTAIFFLIMLDNCGTIELNNRKFIQSYEKRKQNVVNVKNKFNAELELNGSDESNGILDEALISFEQILLDSIIETWYGTKWDFYGTSTVPDSGSIACGYFVTTTLLHSGVKLNRVRLSQCASEEMIKTLVEREDIKRYSNYSIEKYIMAIKKAGKGIYITGLDNHTGFTWYDGKEVWFIHSSGTDPYCVVKEKALETSLLAHSNYRVTGKISTRTFIKKWLTDN